MITKTESPTKTFAKVQSSSSSSSSSSSDEYEGLQHDVNAQQINQPVVEQPQMIVEEDNSY